MIAAGMFIAFVSLRKFGLDDSGPASALLLLFALVGRLHRRHAAEGQERLVLVDLPAAADPAAVRPDALQARRQLALHAVRGLHEVVLRLQPEGRLAGRPQRPGQVLGRLPQAVRGRLPGRRARLLQRCPRRAARADIAALYGQFALYLAASIAVFYALDSLAQRLDAQAHDAVRGDRVLALLLVRRPDLRRRGVAGSAPDAADWAVRAAAIALAAGWVLRTFAKERAFNAQAGPRRRRRAVQPLADLAAGRSMASHRALQRRRARGLVRAGGQARRGQARHVAARGGGGRRAVDRVRLPDGRLRRRSRLRQARDGEPVGDHGRRALDARAARPGREHAHGLLRARAGAGDDVARRPRSRAKPSVSRIAALQVRPRGRARGRARQRHRRRDRGRPRAAAPPARPDRRRRRRGAPPLQPHGHRRA